MLCPFLRPVTGFICAGVKGRRSSGRGSSMKFKPFVIALSIILIAACLATPARAQTTFGTILGTVTDPSGAVMPNVVITVTNQGENMSRDVRSDAQGDYRAENMKEGLYTV